MLSIRTWTASSYRQGDVLLVPCDDIPLGAREEAAEAGQVVLAHGEHTGHSHVMRGDRVCYFRDDGTGGGGAYIRVTGREPVDLSHEEHSPLAIPPGTYRVVQQREYQPRAVPRFVRD